MLSKAVLTGVNLLTTTKEFEKAMGDWNLCVLYYHLLNLVTYVHKDLTTTMAK